MPDLVYSVKDYLIAHDITALWFFGSVAAIVLIMAGFRESLEYIEAGKLKQNLKKICLNAGFYKLSKDENWFVEDLLSNSLLFSRSDLLGFRSVSGFAKKAGDASIYLALVRRDFKKKSGLKTVLNSTFYFFLFSHLESFDMAPLVIHKNNGKFANQMVGPKIPIENSRDDFDKLFAVHSLDITLERADISPGMQEIFLRYKSDYPFEFENIDDIPCVYISKKGLTAIAPITHKESDLMSLFELGAEIMEYYKSEV